MITKLEMKKRAVQTALNTLEKALKPSFGNVIKNQVKSKFEALQERSTTTRTPTLGTSLRARS